MELLQLRYFFDSANTESFAKTAEKYMVPPSSVSITVKRLEKELGCQVFDRHSNRIVLNENGRRLQRRLENIFNELDGIATDFSSKNQNKPVEIKVLIKTLPNTMAEAIIEYRCKYPYVNFKTAFDDDKNKPEQFDLIVDLEEAKYEGWECFKLCSQHLRLRASKNNPICGRTLTMKQLKDQPFVIMNPRLRTDQRLLKACEKAGFVPNIVMEVNNHAYYHRCIEQGIGIGITCSASLPPNSHTAILSVTDFDEWQTNCAYYKNPPKCPEMQDFINYLKCKNF